MTKKYTLEVEYFGVSQHLPKRGKKHNMFTNVQNGFICKSQKLFMGQIFISRWLETQIVVHPYIVIIQKSE